MTFLGAFTKLRNANIIFACLSVCLSVRMKQLGSRWKDFLWNLLFDDFFFKSVEKLQVRLKSDKNK